MSVGPKGLNLSLTDGSHAQTCARSWIGTMLTLVLYSCLNRMCLWLSPLDCGRVEMQEVNPG